MLFTDTYDRLGPFGAKSMSESPFNPVAPALANAVRDATGVRFTALPLAADRIFARVGEASAAEEGPDGSPRSLTLSNDHKWETSMRREGTRRFHRGFHKS